MSAQKSRWATEDPETEAIVAQQKREKEDRKRAKAEKQRNQEAQKTAHEAQAQPTGKDVKDNVPSQESQPPKKRRRLSNESPSAEIAEPPVSTLLRFPAQEWGPCRHVHNFERLNHIEEGSYGYVTRAKDITTGEVVALKKLKMENSPDGFPVTGLREIETLLEARHSNVVYLREIVIGNKLDE